MEHYYALIMAGGGGTRLWPMSRANTPKQLLSLVEKDRSLFAMSVERLHPVFTPERIYVVTGDQYVEALQAEAPNIPTENFIVEPYGRDSGPAAALGMTVIHQRDPEATVAILTADHHIAMEDKFREVLETAYQLAQQGQLVTLGISPSYPATGFGYIQRGKRLETIDGYDCYVAEGFTEKPNVVTATEFVASGVYSWNSGMFILKAQQGMQEFERQQPDMYRVFSRLAATVDTSVFAEKLAVEWENITRISLDFAIMEGAVSMAVIPVDIGWNDIGSWSALYDVLQRDAFGNCRRGNTRETLNLNSRNTLIFSDKLTVTIGLDDIIIIDTEDALLVCKREHAQDVKEVVNHFKSTRKDNYL